MTAVYPMSVTPPECIGLTTGLLPPEALVGPTTCRSSSLVEGFRCDRRRKGRRTSANHSFRLRAFGFKCVRVISLVNRNPVYVGVAVIRHALPANLRPPFAVHSQRRKRMMETPKAWATSPMPTKRYILYSLD